jgi:hypothetical protein
MVGRRTGLAGKVLAFYNAKWLVSGNDWAIFPAKGGWQNAFCNTLQLRMAIKSITASTQGLCSLAWCDVSSRNVTDCFTPGKRPLGTGPMFAECALVIFLVDEAARWIEPADSEEL